MATNLANQLSQLRPDQLATVTFEAGFDANLVFSTASYEGFVASNYNAGNPTKPQLVATESTVQTGLQTGGTISIAFYNQGAGFAFSQPEIDNALQALAMWSGIANITFQYDANPNTASVIFVHAGDTIGPAPKPVAAGTYFAVGTSVTTGTASLAQITGGYIALDNTTKNSDGSFSYGDFTSLITSAGYGFDVLVHEVGHLVGLGHTGPYNANINPALNILPIPNQNNASDVREWSIMSYIDPNAAGTPPAYAANYDPLVTWGADASNTLRTPFTPMGLDVIAAQRLLGAPTNPLFSGGQVFGFNSNLYFTDNNGVSKKLAPYDFALDPLPIVTLFDTGSNNTLDLSGFTTASTVDLRDGKWSHVAGLRNNIFIEWGTKIDRVIGGGGNNVFTANLDSDSFEGGGGGNNRVIFADKRANYAYSSAGGTITLTDTVAGHASINLLHNIQTVAFSDATVSASALSTFLWTGAVSTDFGIAGNWNNLAVPSPGSDVSINGTAGTFVQVVQQQTNTLNSLLIGAGNTLDITVGQFGFSGTTRASNIVGLFEVDSGATAYFGGNLGNYGSIVVAGAFLVDTANVAVSGGGTLRLAGGTIGSFEDANGSPLQYDIFQNTDNTITGYGVIGSSGFVFPIRFINAGLVLADAPLALNVKGATTNTGTLADSGIGTLDLSGAITNTGGTILANGGTGSVVLDGVTITGGRLVSSAGGGFTTFGAVTLDNTGAAIALDGNITLAAGSGLTVIGNLAGTGTIIAAGGGLFLSGRKVIGVTVQGTPTTTLVGNGPTFNGGSPANTLNAAINVGPGQSVTFAPGAAGPTAAANFFNAGSITLAGVVGNGGLMLINSGATSGNTATFTGGGTIRLGSPDDAIIGLHRFAGTDSFSNTDNTIIGVGEIGAGPLHINNSGTIIASGGVLTVDPLATDTVTNSGWIGADATGTLLVQSNFSNTGTVGVVAGGTMAITGSITNSGSIGAAIGSTLVLAGPISNSGTIAALGNLVLIGTLTGGGFGDAGIGGTLTLGGSFGATTGIGALVAENINAGAVVRASSTGGKLTNVRNSGTVAIGADQTISVTGSLTNSGTIALHGSFNASSTLDHPASLLIQSMTTLTGHGVITLSDAGDRIGGTGTLENTDNLISGSGVIDASQLFLVNDAGGIISGTGTLLTLNGGTGRIYNYGTMKAGVGGTLELSGTVVNGTDIIFTPIFTFGGVGTISASGAGAALRLGNTNLNNGIITADTGGAVHVTGAATLTSSSNYIASFGGLVGNGPSSAVENLTNLIIDAGKTLKLVQGLGNFGTISVTSGATLVGSGQLAGLGVVTLSGTARIGGATGVLQNTDNVISGAGEIDGGTTGLANYGGTILANGGTLTVVSATSPFLNSNGGRMQANGGVLHFANSLQNSGYMLAANGTIEVTGSLFGGGQVTLQAGGRLSLGGRVAGDESITFAASGATLDLSDATEFTGPIQGFQLGDVIHLTNIAADTAIWSGATLVASSGGSAVASLTMFPDYSGVTFNAISDNAGGTNITIACFAAGTQIRTANGETTVERLQIGDRIASAFGGTVAVVWLGHRRIDCRRHPRPRDVWPVLVCADAFGQAQPARDLWLSPDHAVYVDDVLIPVRYLINGATIRQVPRDIVTYYHVEAPAHDVIFAEGLATETYLDTGNRAAFTNAGTTTNLHADFARGVWDAEGCARLAISGGAVVMVQTRLLARAAVLGHAMTHSPGLELLVDGQPTLPFITGQTWYFDLPRGARLGRLHSRHFVAAHLSPGAVDHRRLGVAISDLRRDGVTLSNNDTALGHGWHPSEGPWRWTDGDAALRLDGARSLRFTLAMQRRYWQTLAGDQASASSAA